MDRYELLTIYPSDYGSDYVVAVQSSAFIEACGYAGSCGWYLVVIRPADGAYVFQRRCTG